MSKKRLVIANWKMYIESPEEAKAFVAVLKRLTRGTTEGKAKLFTEVEAWIAPSFPLIPPLVASLKNSQIKIGGQGVSAFGGAPFDAAQSKQHTGEVSAKTLKQSGATFTLVGHSERRALGDTNDVVRAQFGNAMAAGLTAVLCVGEVTREESGSHFAVVTEQIKSAFVGLQSLAHKAVVAYEPVWAIGRAGDDAMKPAEVEEMVIFIRKTLADVLGRADALKVPILYGGSVEPTNAVALIKEGGVAGFLVGHASADVESFVEILKSCKK